jgi:Icc-related predicted phosphoesterase
VGSTAVREFLLENQPLLSLHGHIHESPQEGGVWRAERGRAIAVQPGQEGQLTWVEIELEKMVIKRRVT